MIDRAVAKLKSAHKWGTGDSGEANQCAEILASLHRSRESIALKELSEQWTAEWQAKSNKRIHADSYSGLSAGDGAAKR